jgi:hypothetical protein
MSRTLTAEVTEIIRKGKNGKLTDYEEAINDYNELIRSGLIHPRGNQLEDIEDRYTMISELSCNYCK